MVPTTEQKLHINLGFKTRNSTVVLAHGTGKTVDGVLGLWEVCRLFLFKSSFIFLIQYIVIDGCFFFFFFIAVKTK